MTEYIEREEINKAMKEVCDDPSCPMHVAAEIAQIIDCAPTADVAPVVHGRWEYNPPTINTYGQLKCSICNWWTLDPSVDRSYSYCPNCGAKMDGGADND